MSKLCKAYINKIKFLFPIMGKSEKQYIKTLRLNIEDFLESSSEISIDVLYKEFGKPEDIVNLYYENTDTEKIIKRIKTSKYIKICISVVSICLLISTLVFCYTLYSQHKALLEESFIYSEEITIE